MGYLEAEQAEYANTEGLGHILLLSEISKRNPNKLSEGEIADLEDAATNGKRM